MNADGRRAWGNTADAASLQRMIATETAGATGHIDPEGAFTFT